MVRLVLTSCVLSLLPGLAAAGPPASASGPFPPPKTLGPVEKYGAHLQRSMALMATSTGLKRNTVRVLFYGQSITAAEWTRFVAERLRRTYPLVDFVIENRAIPGFSSPFLVKTSEADLYPFYPDLVIFHDYDDGRPDLFEEMIRKLRERTTADILIATDHIAPKLGERMDEETSPLKLEAPKPGHLSAAWRSYSFLPAIARKYHAELADVRNLWKRYLQDHRLSPSDLLYDDLHLNAHGNYLMAEIIFAYLRYRPELGNPDPREKVKTLEVGPEADIQWKDGKLVVPFIGNKVDLICKNGIASPAAIRIDGKKPSEFQQLYVPSRVVMDLPRAPSYLLMRVLNEKPRIIEDWKIAFATAPEGKPFTFRVVGSITGDDGEGSTDKRFVSKSGRVVLEPDDFYLEYARAMRRDLGVKLMVCSWRVQPFFADEFIVPKRKNPFGETVVVAAQGLTNGHHVLEISGGPDTPLAAIRIYCPGK